MGLFLSVVACKNYRTYALIANSADYHPLFWVKTKPLYRQNDRV